MLETCAAESLWHSRLVVASSIPVFVTANYFLLQQEPEFIKGIMDVVLKLLIDERFLVKKMEINFTKLIYSIVKSRQNSAFCIAVVQEGLAPFQPREKRANVASQDTLMKRCWGRCPTPRLPGILTVMFQVCTDHSTGWRFVRRRIKH